MKNLTGILTAATLIAAAGLPGTVQALDVEAAKDLSEQNNCKQCHSLRKDKDGPSFMKTAEKYKGKENAIDEILNHLTSGKEIKLADGTKEKHKVAKTMPANDAAQLKNLAEYILSIEPK